MEFRVHKHIITKIKVQWMGTAEWKEQRKILELENRKIQIVQSEYREYRLILPLPHLLLLSCRSEDLGGTGPTSS